MSMFRQILFPVDLSENSARILPFALNIAQKYQAKLHVLYVAGDLANLGGLAVPHPHGEFYKSEVESGAKRLMKDFYDNYLYGLENVERHIVAGVVADQVVKFANERNVDLIVMGTHGRQGLDRVIFGSVAEKVTRNSPVPVMVVNPDKIKTSA